MNEWMVFNGPINITRHTGPSCRRGEMNDEMMKHPLKLAGTWIQSHDHWFTRPACYDWPMPAAHLQVQALSVCGKQQKDIMWKTVIQLQSTHDFLLVSLNKSNNLLYFLMDLQYNSNIIQLWYQECRNILSVAKLLEWYYKLFMQFCILLTWVFDLNFFVASLFSKWLGNNLT